jgi:sirohydrochlorin ferrochelatase/(2Fe-2S) ferredoxin
MRLPVVAPAAAVPPRPIVVLVGHGSRDADGQRELVALVDAYRAARPDLDVSLACVELQEPSLDTALAAVGARAGRRPVVLVPLFLFAAGHVKNDVPLALAAARARHPQVTFVAAEALGVSPRLVDLAAARARLGPGPDERTALVAVGRGASDPDANADFYKVVRLLGEGRGFAWVQPAFIGIAKPLFPDAIEMCARLRPERILVVPYFLFAGRLLDRLGEQVAAFRGRYPWIETVLTPHLGIDAQLLALVDERVAGALGGARPLPCDTCQYRAPIGGVVDKVGGLRALLWSLRHAFTHTQAMPHVHAHRPLTKHVLVCTNADCAARGSVGLLLDLRRRLKLAGRKLDVRVTRTGCMGRCGEGPTVAVYPDGVWYRGVRAEDAEELVAEHLLGDRLVARLVDQIMQ